MTPPKRVYLARRHPSLSRDAFPDAWRAHHALGQHSAALRRSYPRSAYCVVLDPAFPCDGVGMLWTRDLGVLAAPAADPDAIKAMREDELRVFAAPVFDAATVVTEHVLRPAPAVREGAGCLLVFLRGKADEDWFARVQAGCERVSAPGLAGVVLGKAGPAGTFPCDALAEFWFADGAGALRAAPCVGGALASFGEPPLAMATEVCLAWPPLRPPPDLAA